MNNNVKITHLRQITGIFFLGYFEGLQENFTWAEAKFMKLTPDLWITYNKQTKALFVTYSQK